jgi:ribosomal protein S12 methylthiotransferase
VKEAEFEHLGVFTYSPEEGTAAAKLPRRVPRRTAQARLNAIMKAQSKISLKKNRALIGSTKRVLVDRMEDLVLIGRTEGQAPEIDGVVYLSEVDAMPGEFVDVKITDAREYDLMGEK